MGGGTRRGARGDVNQPNHFFFCQTALGVHHTYLVTFRGGNFRIRKIRSVSPVGNLRPRGKSSGSRRFSRGVTDSPAGSRAGKNKAGREGLGNRKRKQPAKSSRSSGRALPGEAPRGGGRSTTYVFFETTSRRESKVVLFLPPRQVFGRKKRVDEGADQSIA